MEQATGFLKFCIYTAALCVHKRTWFLSQNFRKNGHDHNHARDSLCCRLSTAHFMTVDDMAAVSLWNVSRFAKRQYRSPLVHFGFLHVGHHQARCVP